MSPRSVILGWSDAVLALAEQLAVWDAPVYAVGGAVRDAFLRRPVKDIDLATAKDGIKLARWLANKLGGAFYILDSARDVGRVLHDAPEGRIVIDVARLRGVDLEADLRDRDFTINALAVDLRGALDQVYDPLDGIQDLVRKTLRLCHPDAITNDPIRALRAVRQAAQFGLRIDPDVLRAVRAAAPTLVGRVSPERIRDELFKLLALPKPGTALRVADSVGILTAVLPELAPLHGLQPPPPHLQDVWGHTLAVVDVLSELMLTISPARTEDTAAQFTLGMVVMGLDRYRAKLHPHLQAEWADERPHRALLMLAALLHDAGKPAIPPPNEGGQRFEGYERISAELTERRAESLRLSSAEKERLTAVVRHHMTRIMWQDEVDALALHRFWRETKAAGVDIVLFVLADYLGAVGVTVDQATWLRLVERAQVVLGAYFEHYAQIVEPPPLVTGTQLMEGLALHPGRVIKELLDLIREAQVTGEIATLEEALALARRHLNGRAG